MVSQSNFKKLSVLLPLSQYTVSTWVFVEQSNYGPEVEGTTFELLSQCRQHNYTSADHVAHMSGETANTVKVAFK